MSDPQAKRALLAVCLMTGSMSAIAIIDSIAKQLAVRLHGVQVTWGYFLGMLICLLVVVCVRGVPLLHLTHSHRMHRPSYVPHQLQ